MRRLESISYAISPRIKTSLEESINVCTSKKKQYFLTKYNNITSSIIEHEISELKTAVSKSINESRNLDTISLILEHYRTINTQINQVAKNFINNVIDSNIKDKKDSRERYEQFTLYLLRRYEEYKLKPDTPVNIDIKYPRIKGYGNYQIRLKLLIADSTKYGETSESEYSTKNNIRVKPINIFILPKELDTLKEVKNDRSTLCNRVEQLLQNKRETIVHEITHYYQIKNSEPVNKDEYDLSDELNQYSNLNTIQRFIYKLQAHEITAIINGAYQKYRERGKYFTYKYDYKNIHPGSRRAPIKNKSFFNCLVSSLLSNYDKGELGKLILANKIKFDHLIYGINPEDRFIILWIIFCYLPKENSKFYELIKKEIGDIDKLKTQISADTTKLDNNRNRALAFLRGLTNKERQNLNEFAAKNYNEFYRELNDFFAINDDNNNAIKTLANWAILPRTSS